MRIKNLISKLGRGRLVGVLVVGVVVGVAWAGSGTPDANTVDESVAQAALNPHPPLGGPREFGASEEPVPLGSLRPVHTVTDVTVKGSTGDFALTRHYAASLDAWRIGEGYMLGMPFGAEDVSPDSTTSIRSVHWWHNLYSVVTMHEPACRRNPDGEEVCPAPYYVVRDTSGQASRFEACEPGTESACFAQSRTEQDRKLSRDYSGFVLHTPEGRYYYRRYVETWNVKAYFLSYVEDTQYDASPYCMNMDPPASDTEAEAKARLCRRRVVLTYAAPSECQSNNLQAGQPFVSKAFLSNGSQLVFHYDSRKRVSGLSAGSNECVLKWVSRFDGTNEQTVAEYSYSSVEDGLLTDAYWPETDKKVHYEYRMPDGRRAWIVKVHGKSANHSDDRLVSQKILQDGYRYALEDSSPSRTYLVSADAGTCSPGSFAPALPPGQVSSSPCSTQQDQYFRASGDVLSGEGIDRRLPLEWKFHLANARTQGPVLTRSDVSCISGPVKTCQGQSDIYWAWNSESLPTSSNINPDIVTIAKSERDSNGNWTAYQNQLASDSSGSDTGVPRDRGFLPPAELKKVSQGATDATGSNAQSTREYDYVYGGLGRNESQRAYEQLVKEVRVASVVPEAAGALTQMRYTYEPLTNRLKSVIKHGWTKVYDKTNGSWQLKDRYIGTFYLTQRTCGDTTADAQGRTLEVRGPCLVNGFNSTGCDLGGQIPVTQFEYYPTDAFGNLANRIKRKMVFSSTPAPDSGCSGATDITTTFDSYDFRGNVLASRDANGVTTNYSYQGERLLESTTGSVSMTDFTVTTQYGYDDGGHGDFILYPDGHYEVMCFREGATASCTGGKLSDKLQWKAKAANFYGTPWAEKVVYTYRDGALAGEAYLDADGTTRRTRRYESDPLGRTAFEGWGAATPAGGYAQTRLYDAQGSLRGLGLPYNTYNGSLTPPALCDGFSNNAPASRYCKAFQYDQLNRLARLVEPLSDTESADTLLRYDAQGNLAGVKQGCGGSSSYATCGQAETAYTHDDFGNLVEVTAPWSNDGAGNPGTFRYAYDVAGNLVVKQTPAMAQAPGHSRVEYTYDDLGRVLEATAMSDSGADRLYSYVYDGSASLAPGFPGSRFLRGRVQKLTDSFGETWYQYDGFGRVTAAYRRRAGAAACSEQNTNDTPNRRFEYFNDGRLKSETYPHGRVVTYEYQPAATGQPGRLAALKVKLWNGTAFEDKTLLSNVKWEPFGGVREYQVHAPMLPEGSNLATVEYLLGGSNTSPGTCASSRSDVAQPPGAPYDLSGRLRALWVSTGGTSGSRSGDIFKRVFTWRGDQLAEEATCVLDTSTTPFTKVRYSDAAGGNGYDRRLQLTHVSRPAGEFTQRGGSVGRRDYAYDARSNVSSITQDCWTFAVDRSSSRVDQVVRQYLTSKSCGTNVCGGVPNLGRDFTYDADGRVASIAWTYKASSGSTPQTFAAQTFSSQLDGAHAAVGAVFKSVTLNNNQSLYEYFYDANGRRRLKRYPTNKEDEFFYDGTKLLEDRGNASTLTTAQEDQRYSLDEYIWLDGRPVAFIKSMFDPAWQHQNDFAVDCKRNGDSAPCGVYFLVTDYLGKPVLALDSYRRITGVADYDPFGHVNRVTAEGDTAHPYAPNSNMVLGYFQQSAGPGMQVQMRARYSGVDVRYASAYAYLSDAYDHELGTADSQSTRVSTSDAPAALTGWVNVPADGRVHARFRSGGEQGTSYGVSLAGYEYRRFQQGASPVWTPLRFPGHYNDAETDLFENWNRFYDANLGRYLGPEPKYQQPQWVLEQNGLGRSPPIYAYASANPIVSMDPDGLAALSLGITGNAWLFVGGEFSIQFSIDDDLNVGLQGSIGAREGLGLGLGAGGFFSLNVGADTIKDLEGDGVSAFLDVVELSGGVGASIADTQNPIQSVPTGVAPATMLGQDWIGPQFTVGGKPGSGGSAGVGISFTTTKTFVSGNIRKYFGGN